MCSSDLGVQLGATESRNCRRESRPQRQMVSAKVAWVEYRDGTRRNYLLDRQSNATIRTRATSQSDNIVISIAFFGSMRIAAASRQLFSVDAKRSIAAEQGGATPRPH